MRTRSNLLVESKSYFVRQADSFKKIPFDQNADPRLKELEVPDDEAPIPKESIHPIPAVAPDPVSGHQN